MSFKAEMERKRHRSQDEDSITNSREIPYTTYDVIHGEAANGRKDSCDYARELVEQMYDRKPLLFANYEDHRDKSTDNCREAQQ